ncbi:MAG: thiamine diphosphokinase [Lachnospiraceae bacterium]|nr:thiamine diphosphokinase [Clostridium sp.]MDD6180329.1 thiamine diphosphokinase [Clostridium sp.]MDY4820704.1 thiamine diphosphokinase [Lachnospiraceae bacterium]
MKQAITEYKQAIIIGASPMGSEESALLKLLKWAGYGEQAEHCSRDCDTCHTGCSAKIKNKDIYVVVADGGLKFLLKNGMLPDFFVGDLDSVELEDTPTEKTQSDGMQTEDTPTGKAKPEGALKDILKDIPKEIVPVEKDDTDMALAVAKAYEKGYRNILLYGGCGGARISHTLANIQMMSFYAKKGCSLQMLGDGVRLEILHNASKTLSAAMKGSISVICLSDIAEGVTIQGLKYEYTGALTSDRTLGVSNSFVGKDAMVSVENGTLLLVYERA